MRNVREVALCAAGMIAASSVSAFGAGYCLFQGSARGNVDSAELIASGGEPASMYFNGATITELPGTQVQLGFTAIAPFASVETVSPYNGNRVKTDGKDKIWPIPSAYVTHQLNDDLYLGFGIFSRFGLGAELSNTWPGRYSSYKAMIEAVDFMPTIAWKINDMLSVSAGVTIRYFDIELAQKVDLAGATGLRNPNDPAYSPYDVDQNLHGDDINAGINLGSQFKPVDYLDFGAEYQSRIRFVCKGDADWTKPAPVNALAPYAFNDMKWSAKNYNPDEVMLAGSWKINDRLTFSAGALLTYWSIYDDLVIDMKSDYLPGRNQMKSEKNWHDAWRAMLGLAYKTSDSLTLRCGYTFDNSPLNGACIDYLVPGDDRQIFAVGATWEKSEKWVFDFSYFYEVVSDKDINARVANGVLDGTFCDADAHAVSFSVTRRF